MIATRPILEWMPLFLAARARGYEVPAAYTFAKVDESAVETITAKNPQFRTACAMIDREHRRRAWVDGKAKAEMVSNADLQDVAENIHASLCVHHADTNTLLLLCKRITSEVGIDDLDGLPIIDWFNHQRRVQLERLLLSIGDTNPEAVGRMERHFDRARSLAGADSILQPPKD